MFLSFWGGKLNSNVDPDVTVPLKAGRHAVKEPLRERVVYYSFLALMFFAVIGSLYISYAMMWVGWQIFEYLINWLVAR